MADEKKVSELTADELAVYANEGLVAKNNELLTEVKKFKASTGRLQTELDAASAELTEIKFNRPVDEMLGELFLVPGKIARKIIDEYVQFELDGGNLVVRDKDGKPMMIKPSDKEPEREAVFDAKDLKYIFVQTGELNSVLAGPKTSAPGMYKGPVVIPTKETDFSSQLGVK